MILPGKHLSQDRALLSIGARLLIRLAKPKTVSALWEEMSPTLASKDFNGISLRYDTYVLALDLLYLIGAIDLMDGLLLRRQA